MGFRDAPNCTYHVEEVAIEKHHVRKTHKNIGFGTFVLLVVTREGREFKNA